MEAIQTQAAVDQSKVPGATLAEFGKRDFDKQTRDDLGALEAEINAHLTGTPVPKTVYEAPVGQPPVVDPPAAPPTPEPAPFPVQTSPIPDKFANPDGSLNQDKLQKSYVNLEAYLQRERELGQLKQQQQFQPPPPQYAPPPPQYQQPYIPIEQQVNDGMRQDPGMTALNLARAAVNESRAYADAQLREVRSRQELMEMGQNDPAVFTAEGLAKLTQVRKENPWLDLAPNPWYAAYKLSGGIAPRNSAPVAAPARTSAPILPGGQAPSGIPATNHAVSTEGDLRRALENKFPNDPAKQYQALEAIIARQSQR